ncbi:hypothetical protein M406DRAFT_101161 [Cryphonectria parasitica EP155]|uniref:Uncharacterized protein n=1 Tax=Cryphonectria parasitica (strain ATCC 38755 / EP155) TaxID=660469 RepID=A0A9P4YE15_CRYP1|nr:uncharacterized protein M406DRAFT_101161 [Cryphonectria parasitica EP155]KAF3771235.1 hypothetical protein M406DRAFT_101161 [Cryphonectria parasitica EP155]
MAQGDRPTMTPDPIKSTCRANAHFAGAAVVLLRVWPGSRQCQKPDRHGDDECVDEWT